MLGLGALHASAQARNSINFTCTTGPLAAPLQGESQVPPGTQTQTFTQVLTGFNFIAANTVPIGSQTSGVGAGKALFDPISITFALTPTTSVFFAAVELSSSPSKCTLLVPTTTSSGTSYLVFNFAEVIPTQASISNVQSGPQQSQQSQQSQQNQQSQPGLVSGLQGTITFNYAAVQVYFATSLSQPPPPGFSQCPACISSD
jgi:hypothetical protein